MNKEQERKAILSAIEAGEIVKYTPEYFRLQGSIGGKKRWEGETPEERSAYMSAIAKKPRKKKKLSTH